MNIVHSSVETSSPSLSINQNNSQSSSTSETEYERNRKYHKKNIKLLVQPIDDINYHNSDFLVCDSLQEEIIECIEKMRTDICRCENLYNDINNLNVNCSRQKKMNIDVLRKKLKTQQIKGLQNIERYVTSIGNVFDDIAENILKRLCRIVTKIEHMHCRKIRPVFSVYKDMKFIETLIRLINERASEDLLEQSSNISLFDGECCVDLDEEKKCKVDIYTCSDKNEAILKHIINNEFTPELLDLSQQPNVSLDEKYFKEIYLTHNAVLQQQKYLEKVSDEYKKDNYTFKTVCDTNINDTLKDFMRNSKGYERIKKKHIDTFSRPEKIDAALLNNISKMLPCMFYSGETDMYNMMYYIEAGQILLKYFQSYMIYKIIAHLLLDDNNDVSPIMNNSCSLSDIIVEKKADEHDCSKNEKFILVKEIYDQYFQKFNEDSEK